jgi:hypothetical protein
LTLFSNLSLCGMKKEKSRDGNFGWTKEEVKEGLDCESMRNG